MRSGVSAVFHRLPTWGLAEKIRRKEAVDLRVRHQAASPAELPGDLNVSTVLIKAVQVHQRTDARALAIAAALSQPWSDVVLSGAVTTNQLQSNLHAATLSELRLEWPMMSEQPIEYWRHRSTLPWT